MKRQDARYIPQRRMGDKARRRWNDRLTILRLALAMIAMVVVAFVLFQLFSRYA
jgi:type VI protein secretion system component VasF